MIDVHFSATSRQVYIDEGSRQTVLNLPDGLDAVEIAYVLQSDTLKAIIAQLSGKVAQL